MNYLQNLRIQLTSTHQTQKISIPESLEILRSVVSNTFLTLPQQWDLTYINSDNQETILDSEQDFHDLLAGALRASSKIIAILIKERRNIPEPVQDPEYQIIDEKSEGSVESQFNIFKEIANLRRLFESNAASQFLKDSVLSVISEYVVTPNLSVRQQLPQLQQQGPKVKASEGRVANLIISENTLEDLFEKMINKNIHNIASMAANILQNKEGQPQSQAAHENARCHECGTSPIIGIKFLCAVCPNYEICEACEATHDQAHALIKIKHPGQQYKVPQEKQGGDSKSVSMVQSDFFEVSVQNEENLCRDEEGKSSSISQKNQIEAEPGILEIIKEEEPKGEDKQAVEEEEKEEKVDLGAEEKEEEKPLEIKQEELLISTEVKELYSVSVIEKAKELHQLLPEARLEVLLEFVNSSPNDVDVVELMERFQLL